MKPRVIAIIPARGGSKGLPRKNLLDLAGTPLIGWSIAAARASALIDEVVVTTDSPEIAAVCQSLGATVPYSRPAELATDTACVGRAVQHVHDHLLSIGRRVDITVVLFPTHPFRTPQYLNYLISLCLLGAGAAETMHGFWWDCRHWYAIPSSGTPPQPIRGTSGGLAGHKFQLAGVYRHTQTSTEYSDHFARNEALHYGIAPERARTFRADQQALASQIAYPITDEVLRHDIDTPHDLEVAHRFIREGRVPWIPGKSCPPIDGQPLANFGALHEFLFPGTRAARLSAPNDYIVELLGTDRTETIILDELPATPRDLRQQVRRTIDCGTLDVWIRQNHVSVQSLAVPAPVPSLVLDKNHRIPTGIGRIYSRRGRAYMDGGITVHSDTALTLACSVDRGLEAILLEPPHSGDCLRVRTLPAADTIPVDTILCFTEGKWVQQNTLQPHDYDFAQRKITLGVSAEAGAVAVEWFTDGLGTFPSGQLFIPITVAEWTRYDSQSGEWIDTHTNQPIRGRQSYPPIFPWSGAAFLPAQQSADDQWHFV